jgi:hypothetical protein
MVELTSSDARSTDTENETLPFTRLDPEWKVFEKNIADEQRRLEPGATVLHDTEMLGLVSGTLRQVDVLVTGQYLGRPIRVAIECKRYARKLGIGKVDEFAGKLLDLEVEYGILYAFNGLTGPAKERAERATHPTILVGEIKADPIQSDLPDWDRFFKALGDCENPNCGGEVSWRDWPQEEGNIVDAGRCTTCGTWAYRCIACDESALLTDFPLACSCSGNWTYQVVEDHNGGEDVIAKELLQATGSKEE